MAKLFAQIRFIAGALALAFMLAAATPAAAQVNPTASAVKEQQLLNALQGGVISGRVSIPDQKSANLIQPAGREWRQWHEVTLRWIGAIAVIGALVLMVITYMIRGRIMIKGGRSGRVIVRFNAFERFIHWLTASCFIVLAISGLNITFGKALLLPLLGPEAFTTWSELAKYAHNYLSFPFTIGVVLIFLTWIGGNIPNANDVAWFKSGGGIFGEHEAPAGHFNGGQKMIYWIVVIGGGASAVTGYLLLFPFYATDIGGMQLSEVIHAIVAMLFIVAMLGHIYLGTVGEEGAFEAMSSGTVDVNWAKQHHPLWLQDQMSSSKDAGRARPMATPAE
ncbi:MAG: formate dehydrogenase subunit gamma [Rhizobiales bacterium]|nr:formate dehydrogenase subunit gamma [Hyphomicrobiales bacterium]